MKRSYVIIILIAASVTNLKGQIYDELVIKTNLLKDVVSYNPNIGLEKILTKKYSLEIEFTYKNRDNEYSGKDIDLWSYKKSNGYRIQSSLKRYFTKSKEIPNAWFLMGQLGFRNVHLPEFITYYKSGEYFRTADINKKRIEATLLFGREFHIYKNLLTEINLGVGINWEKYDSKLISGSNADEKYENGLYETEYISPNFFINWTIGYLLISKK
ncbi:MAG: DUF3575 domain-containing protein [Bacteroidales bacterium]|jgi:hypothetical protein|nr:DUF3575 domain-containing protein [Bacteroidales bacterium]